MLPSSLRFLRVPLFLLLSSLAALAQYNGNIQGVVTDPSDAAVANASVRLHNLDNGIQATTTTSSSGNYRFSSLEPGHYTVTVMMPGFSTQVMNLTLATSETQGINVKLVLASASEAVSVTAEAPVLDTDETRLQATLNSNTLHDLPQANRNLWDVLAVAPGVVGTGTRAAGESPGGLPDNFGTQTPQISANGRSYTGNLVMVDGMNVTSPIQNGNIILAPIPEAVQEATLQTNSWDGNINLGSSILVQVTTKSGTNKFHGSGSMFFNNQNLVATPYFTAPGSYLPYGRKDLVGTFGGPIQKDKTFFFADFEKLWATTAGSSSGQLLYEDPQFVQW